MRTKTIKGKIFNVNLTTVTVALVLVAISFNLAINLYFQNQVMSQLSMAASSTKDTFAKQTEDMTSLPKENQALAMTSHRLENSFNKNLSVINAQSFLVDNRSRPVIMGKETTSLQSLQSTILAALLTAKDDNRGEKQAIVDYADGKYAAILIPAPANQINISYIVLFSNLEQINALQRIINYILLIILATAALISIFISSSISRQIAQPLTSLNEHIRSLSERKFGTNLNLAADNEIQELLDNVNIMSDKLEAYDKSQKLFLENASHEFRTPLMIIQSYAEGLQHGVVEDKEAAIRTIIGETERLHSLVEDLLYLSRLDTDEEMYRFSPLDFSDLLQHAVARMKVLAEKDNIDISLSLTAGDIWLCGDEEKLVRATSNIISNCLRFARSAVTVQASLVPNSGNRLSLLICDDGPGLAPEDLAHLFTRFYRGKKGKFGLGLAIAKTIIEKHSGSITAKNSDQGGACFEIVLVSDTL